jgi:hypothetical protein
MVKTVFGDSFWNFNLCTFGDKKVLRSVVKKIKGLSYPEAGSEDVLSARHQVTL